MDAHADSRHSLDALLARYGDLVTAEMRATLDGHDAPHDFYGMLRYHLGWVDEQLQPIAASRGKGLRGALVLLVNEALGGDEGAAAPLAAAIDLLHNFSLIHDDIEDGSPTRRHRATLWSVWGVPLGINAGDGLFALAHLALYRSSLRQGEPRRFVDIMHAFERATLHICEGQHLDMTFEGRSDVSVDDYLRMIGGKTAALIAAAAWIGARAALDGEETARTAGRFGRELGLAFQMQDDILGIWGDEATTGKSASSDIASRKKTLPVLLALEHAAPANRARLRALYAVPGHDSSSDAAVGGVAAGDDAREIVALLDGAGARDLAGDYLRRHREAALAALDELGIAAPARERLRQFAGLFVDRTA